MIVAFESQRRTGRTTRMLRAALKAAEGGQSVCVVMHTGRAAQMAAGILVQQLEERPDFEDPDGPWSWLDNRTLRHRSEHGKAMGEPQ